MSGYYKEHSTGRQRRKIRIRKRVVGTPARPRLNVFRSASHIYAQVINDVDGTTLASASTLGTNGTAAKKLDKARSVGFAIAEACKAISIEAVVFDRNGYRYHGRVRAIAEAAREGGLRF